MIITNAVNFRCSQRSQPPWRAVNRVCGETFRPAGGCAREPLPTFVVSKKESDHATDYAPGGYRFYRPRVGRCACTIDRPFGTTLRHNTFAATPRDHRPGWRTGACRAPAAAGRGRAERGPNRHQSGRYGDRSEAQYLPRLPVKRARVSHLAFQNQPGLELAHSAREIRERSRGAPVATQRPAGQSGAITVAHPGYGAAVRSQLSFSRRFSSDTRSR